MTWFEEKELHVLYQNETPICFLEVVLERPPFLTQVNLLCELASDFGGFHPSCKVNLRCLRHGRRFICTHIRKPLLHDGFSFSRGRCSPHSMHVHCKWCVTSMYMVIKYETYTSNSSRNYLGHSCTLHKSFSFLQPWAVLACPYIL